MKLYDYVSHIVEAIPDDALIVSSHTDNTSALVGLEETNRSLLGFNMGLATPVGLG